MVFINPEIVCRSDETQRPRGRLPVDPGILRGGRAPGRGDGRYLDLDGKQHEIEADGLLATCLQHEIDHLNGVLFIDHISKLKRDRVVKKFTKAAKQAAGEGRAPSGRLAIPRLTVTHGAPPDLHGHAGLRGADACSRVVGHGHDVAAVYTRAPKPAGRRGLELTPSPVEREARELGLPVLTPASLKGDGGAGRVRARTTPMPRWWSPTA